MAGVDNETSLEGTIIARQTDHPTSTECISTHDPDGRVWDGYGLMVLCGVGDLLSIFLTTRCPLFLSSDRELHEECFFLRNNEWWTMTMMRGEKRHSHPIQSNRHP
eukprot:CAMPEP_0170867970 /NCGR_PEP_ID=MMETSP0734-20130129/23205_1 /TAXON_ID=186038 /ORGANISM="Fragilariopsis kerguelensis, Strain L26-C5" /LENGTH=105 /DNA_ID=CAMNT_0011245501 /DNA_START=5 /DNA_END=322 /DNA_ORIENTATION=+